MYFSKYRWRDLFHLFSNESAERAIFSENIEKRYFQSLGKSLGYLTLCPLINITALHKQLVFLVEVAYLTWDCKLESVNRKCSSYCQFLKLPCYAINITKVTSRIFLKGGGLTNVFFKKHIQNCLNAFCYVFTSQK